MSNIQWGTPYKIYEGPLQKWRREWHIPPEYLNAFFCYWKLHKYELLADDYTIIKDKILNGWILFQTKDSISKFKNVDYSNLQEEAGPYIDPHPGFVLPSYKVKNTDGLRPWQERAVGQLVSSINTWNSAVDGSDLGLGKTYVACAVARELDYHIFVICPKSVMKSWEKVITSHFNLKHKLKGILNYEQVRTGKKSSPIASFVLNRETRRKQLHWKLPKNTLIIWDEAHKLKNWNTKNSKLCVSAMRNNYPMLFCSATLATNPLELRTVGMALKIFNRSPKAYYTWAKQHGVIKGAWGLEFTNDPLALNRVNHTLFNQSGIRLRREIIPDFPKCDIISDVYNMENESVKQINLIHQEMESELARLRATQLLDKLNAKKYNRKELELTIQLRARQQIELIKVPLFIEMIQDAIDQGFSIVVFLNFSETIAALSSRLNIKCIYDGDVKNNRDDNVEQFQADKERVILINILSGGAGLNLHDLNGNFPRLALISPTYSPVLMRQATGRIWRDGAKTKAIQKIIFVADTIEEKVCENVKQKLNNLDILNDGDLTYETTETS